MTVTTDRQPGLAATATLTHGFSLADVDRAARKSVKMRRRIQPHSRIGLEEEERTAWFGIVQYLYECGCGTGTRTRTSEPTFIDLLRAGTAEISDATKAHLRYVSRDKTGEWSPNFRKFWLPPRRDKHYTSDGFSDQLCDRLALREALGVLTAQQYQAIAALAAFDTRREAADALGITLRVLDTRVANARRIIKEVWTGDVPETPSEPSCKRGHVRSEHGRQDPSTGAWVCRPCRRLNDNRRNKDATAAKGFDAA